VHIATIEDPIEFNIEGLSQMQVNNKTNLTFANGLRAIVRQDPDIIMIGEVRDLETANIAINSALTGHFVLSSFHAKSACATLPRLIDMGAEPYLVSSAMNIILSQKLVRKICDKCKYSYSLSEEDADAYKDSQSILDIIAQKTKKNIKDIMFFKGSGCNYCGNTGYKDRIGIFEILIMSERMKKLVNKKASENEILEIAKQEGMTTMVDDGVEKILNGTTTIEEIMNVIIE
jgi:type II secretory ATPase GspE/PulE/Tfp pilus assembly ATPase PilB-like protein